MHGNAHRKTTIWLGSDNGDPLGMNGYGFSVDSKDDMISIGATIENDHGEDLEVFIMRDLFPGIRAVMTRIDNRFQKTGPQHGLCAQCGLPAAFQDVINPDRLCAICAAGRAADGGEIMRIGEE